MYGFRSVAVLPGVIQSVCSVTPLWPGAFAFTDGLIDRISGLVIDWDGARYRVRDRQMSFLQSRRMETYIGFTKGLSNGMGVTSLWGNLSLLFWFLSWFPWVQRPLPWLPTMWKSRRFRLQRPAKSLCYQFGKFTEFLIRVLLRERNFRLLHRTKRIWIRTF